MAPKKRDREDDSGRGGTTDQLKQDHELFLQAFEKPTQIYRYLRARSLVSPLFLHRNLTYMRRRTGKKLTKSQLEHVDNILSVMEMKQRDISGPILGRYLTISHMGFYMNKDESLPSLVRVETSLKKLCQKRRKESSMPVVTTSFGCSEVVVNPTDGSAPPTVPTSCIPAESFSTQNGTGPKSFILTLRVSLIPSNRENEEPSNKRRKLVRSASAANGLPPGGGLDELQPLRAELPITDRAGRCLLTDGEYDVILTPDDVTARPEGRPRAASPRKTTWEAFEDGKAPVPLDTFSSAPTLKLRLAWTNQVPQPQVERPRPLQPRDTNQMASGNKRSRSKKEESNSSSTSSRESSVAEKDKPSASVESPPLVLYHFIYSHASRQQTEAREDLICPWCSLDCHRLYSLLKHLQLCHARLTFSYTPMARGARIDVSLNDAYDSAYVGNPYDLARPPRGAATRPGPNRRTPSTSVLVCRPRRVKPSLAEFLQSESEERMRPLVTGHNRMYHRTSTNMPIPPAEIDYDSEGEHDHPWLRAKTRRMINEFSDVNEGEKELMVMWNLHAMKHNFVGDCQMPAALSMFIEHHGAEMVEKNLYRNFILHLSSLYDFGVISPGFIHRAIQQFQELIERDGQLTGLLAKNLLGDS